MSERSTSILLLDMQEAIDAIQQYVTDVDYHTFLANGMIRDAVIRNVQVLGEAANRVPKTFREQHPVLNGHVSFEPDIYLFTTISVWTMKSYGGLLHFIFLSFGNRLIVF